MPRILVITANSTLPRLQIMAEARNIRAEFGAHSNFAVAEEHEARSWDLIQKLLDQKPDILHFAGHGTGGGEDSGIVLTNDAGEAAVLTASALSRIFGALKQKPKLVFLNCCYSSQQAGILTDHVEVVVGVQGKIGDALARRFAANFYSCLARSMPVKRAFELARDELINSDYDPSQVCIVHRKQVDPDQVVFYGRPEMLARFELTANNRPIQRNEHYLVHLWMRGVDEHIDSVTYQICHDSFAAPFWEVMRSEDPTFWTDDLRTTGEITIRATAWSRDLGVGVASKLSDALRRHYGELKDNSPIAKALKDLESS